MKSPSFKNLAAKNFGVLAEFAATRKNSNDSDATVVAQSLSGSDSDCNNSGINIIKHHDHLRDCKQNCKLKIGPNSAKNIDNTSVDDDNETWMDIFAVLTFMGTIIALMIVTPLFLVTALPCFSILLGFLFPTIAAKTLVAGTKTLHSMQITHRYIMHLQIWNNYRRYFRAKLVRTTPLPASRNYIFAGHPHGVYCLGLYANILSNPRVFSNLFPGIQVSCATLPINFWIPLWRDFMLSLGFVSCEGASLRAVLKGRRKQHNVQKDLDNGEKIKKVYETQGGNGTGRALYIAIGGADEFLLMEPGTMDLVILKRKGFARMALMTGASLVPVLTFGETDYINRVDTPFTRKLSEFTHRLARFAIPVLEGRFGIAFPRRARLVTILGEPLHIDNVVKHPTHQQVDEIHAKYLESLQSLYERHKDEYFDHRIRDMQFVK
ncbi:diacylglycerol O-acyltransferase 1 [Physocladia obscura]|uniref:Diacylglycerol O-acyltransferase n=1 Tax=Physocladia obscura TaxID=109957 RepID=A0AAD5XE15_9FUNG|nr:diacylglycerol O-acyltransferase 1 [Physocladia obscura]